MRKPRTRYEKIDGIQRTLEGYRRFDFDYIPFGPHWSMPDGNYRYRRRGLDALMTGFWRTVLFLFGWILIGVCYGVRTTGRKNLRPLRGKGAILVTNHFSYLDTLLVRHAAGHFRTYHTMGPRNNKTGFGGWVIRHGGMLPFSADREATRALNAEIERVLKKGAFVNFYAEQALWTNYQKPRPMQSGAFHYAVKHGVPVVPIFCTFRKNKRGHMKRMRIHILPAIYADGSLPRREKMDDMRARAETAWRECYEQAYGRKLSYCADRRLRRPRET